MSGAVESAEGSRRLRPYDEYSHESAEWPGGIPAHWRPKRLKFECSRSALYGANESAASYSQEGIRFLRTTDIDDAGSLRTGCAVYLPEELVRDYRLTDGDILISRSGTVGRALHYRSSLHGPCAYAGYLVRFIPKRSLDSQFVFYYTKSRAFMDWLSVSAIQSTIGNINGQKYGNLLLPTPGVEEQRHVARFLDRETGKIDALIAKKERLIELLQEKRTALITHAVTKGLNPDAPTKPSGFDWVGSMPEHWAVSPLSAVAHFASGRAHEPFIDDDGQFVCVNSRFVSTEGGAVKRCVKNLSPAKRGDVLCVMSDLPNGRALAKAFLVTEDERLAVNQRVCRLTAHAVHPEFLFYYVSRNPFLLRYDDGLNQTHLPNSAFTKCPVLLPPYEEQVRIAEHLKVAAVRSQSLVQNLRQATALLQELRTALISAAVTGKIDVREEVA